MSQAEEHLSYVCNLTFMSLNIYTNLKTIFLPLLVLLAIQLKFNEIPTSCTQKDMY